MRHITYTEKPDFVPDFVYSQAKVCQVDTTMPTGSSGFGRLLRSSIVVKPRQKMPVSGDQKRDSPAVSGVWTKIGKWFEEFLDMGDIFQRSSIPTTCLN
jgi:hypothetical protein